MSLSNALFSSVTGLGTASTAISVIGDNIANVSTPGFKERRAEFSDVLGQSLSTAGGFSQTGAGSTVARIGQIFSQGSFETTERPTDLAIEGRGFFILEGQVGRNFSRAGIFTFDNAGTLVDSSGLRVQGFGIDPTTLQPVGQLGDIQINATLAPPRPSTEVNLSVNLDSNELPNGPFDPADPTTTSGFQTGLTLFDSLGNAQPTNIYYTNTGVNTWEWNATLPDVAGGPDIVQGTGTLTFDTQGGLTAVTGSPVTFNFPGGAAPAQVVDIDFGPLVGAGPGDPTTQFAETSTVNSATQDGFAPGTLQGISVDREGFINASFSNGETRPIAQVALATFANVEGLQAIGNNLFSESRDSGQPLVGAAGTGQFGSVRSNSIEQSNVDLAAQFIRLIMNQRAFQANTRTVSTTNELLANLVQLGQ
ncbi:MAG: flagellar hook protein FlgE [Myxococcales bacterium]|nr:flagellar hook protein FlgE [Myxococcales bacterium]